MCGWKPLACFTQHPCTLRATFCSPSLLPPPTADLEKVDSVNKLDPTNTAQLEQLHCLFFHNMAAVDFYLKWGGSAAALPRLPLSCRFVLGGAFQAALPPQALSALPLICGPT